jgi:hypothetical protein
LCEIAEQQRSDEAAGKREDKACFVHRLMLVRASDWWLVDGGWWLLVSEWWLV